MKEKIRSAVLQLGADVCGFASAEGFDQAPAGLGTLGKNTLLLNKDYGNRLVVGCVLTDLDIEPDEPAVSICPDNCRLCIENCPQRAIKSGFVEQKTCRLFSYGKTKRGFETVECNRCRTVCPMRFGIKKGKGNV